MNHLPLPPQSELLKLLDYDPITGFVTRKAKFGDSIHNRMYNKRYIGTKIQLPDSKGSQNSGLHVKVNKVCYQLTRVIWMMVHGVDPGDQDVININKIKKDNRLVNLKVVPRPERAIEGRRKRISKWGNMPLKERNRLASAEWRQKHPEKAAAWVRRWQKAHPENMKANANRWAQKKRAETEILLANSSECVKPETA